MFAIRVEGSPIPGVVLGIEGMFVKTFDFEHNDGQGFGTFTANINEAKMFDSFEDAVAFWKRQSTSKPIREDGQPNRPLTSTSVSFVKV